MIYETFTNNNTGITAELIWINDVTWQYKISDKFSDRYMLSSEYSNCETCREDMIADYDDKNTNGF